jgi:hypothetical protein
MKGLALLPCSSGKEAFIAEGMVRLARPRTGKSCVANSTRSALAGAHTTFAMPDMKRFETITL